MLFNSVDFLYFFPIVFVLYWFVFGKSLKAQNLLLLVASYYFYAAWDFRFLFLLMFSTLLDYFTGIKIHEAPDKRRKQGWLWLSISINVGFLGIFKYYNFFVTSFSDLLEGMGMHADPWTLQVILPVGISFYTFHGLSYVFDIYHDRIKPERRFVEYGVFVSFFPLLVAGPIERATHLLPQLVKPRAFTYRDGVAGLRLMLFGFFKKVVIADSLSSPVADIFSTYSGQAGGTLILGVVFFAVQIYCDFSGYSDIASGTARLLGIELIRNFNFPYFSRSITEFWRKWHISLSTWFRDYLYKPLGGSYGTLSLSVRNVLIVFLVSGFWHGANWTFIVWGLIHAIYFIPSFIVRKSTMQASKEKEHLLVRVVKDGVQMALTFSMVCFAWIFFRAESLGHAWDYIRHISIQFNGDYMAELKYIFLFGAFEVLVYFFTRLDGVPFRFRIVRYAAYTYLLITVVTHSTKAGSAFIYFQF